MGKKKNNRKKHLGRDLLLITLKRVFRRDEKYIHKVLEINEDSDYLEIRHNGDFDYGKIVYVIKENTKADGFCATLRFVLLYLIFAKQHGLAPVIRLTKDFAYYDEDMSSKIENPWEYYFETDDSIDEKNALNVSYCHYLQRDLMRERYDFSAYKTENYYDDTIFELCSPVIREYMKLKPAIIKESEEILKEITESGGKVLGVHFRGTDYKKGYNNHPVFVDEKQTAEEIKKALDTGRFKAVFLATDDVSAMERIMNAIPEIPVLLFQDVFRGDGNESVAFSNSDRKYHRYLLGYEIARDMYTLSLCDGLVAVKSSVGFLSNLYKHSRNEEYEYMKIMDNGNNNNENEYFKES